MWNKKEDIRSLQTVEMKFLGSITQKTRGNKIRNILKTGKLQDEAENIRKNGGKEFMKTGTGHEK